VIDCKDGKLYASELEVKGLIRASEIKVEAQTADFVFEEDYQLRPLQEVEAFVKANKHLPEIPSAQEMEKEGVNVAQMNKLLLQKVEELTLYSIEQEKKLAKQEKQLVVQKEKLNELDVLKKEVAVLRTMLVEMSRTKKIQ
jgi:DNA polymerase III delta prime subunit